MNQQDIRKTLTYELSKWSSDNSIDIHYPNLSYEPTVGQAYIQQWFMEGGITDTVLAEGQERYFGIMQLDINVPSGEGEGTLFLLYNSLKLIFNTNKSINNKYGAVRLGKVRLSNNTASSPWYTKHMTIEYTAFSSN